MPKAKPVHITITDETNVIRLTSVSSLRGRGVAARHVPALSDPLGDNAADQIAALAEKWAAAGPPWVVAAPAPAPKPQQPAGVPFDRTLERARLLVELAASWGVDLRLALAMGKGTAASPTARPVASIPPDAPSVLPFRSAAMTEGRP